MKKLLFLLFIGISLAQTPVRIVGTSPTGTPEEVTSLYLKYTIPDSLYEAGTDTLTTSWADMGAEIDMRGYTQLNIYITLDINSCKDARVRALGKYESGGSDEYPFVIESVSSTDIKIDAEYVEFNTDADQLAILKIQVEGVPYIQLQMQVGTAAGGAQFDKVYINKIWK